MKLNISYPANGSQKLIEVDDERKLRPFMEKRMGTEVSNHPSLSKAFLDALRVAQEQRKLIGILWLL